MAEGEKTPSEKNTPTLEASGEKSPVRDKAAGAEKATSGEGARSGRKSVLAREGLTLESFKATAAVSADEKGTKSRATHKALVVGINNYPDPRNFLPSCIADAQAFEQLLRHRLGFGEIVTLLDGDATAAAFVGALERLVDGAGEESRLVLYYSGHGYQHVENGVQEEFLVLFDGLLPDGVLADRTQNLPPGVLTIVMDACFSGGLEKRRFEVTDPAAAERAKLKVWQPPPELEAADEARELAVTAVKPFGSSVIPALADKAWRKSLVVPSDPTEAGQLQLQGLLISASTENETAAASTSQTRGRSAFTHCLLTVLDAAGLALSTRELIERTVAELRALGFRQTPQIKEPPLPGNLSEQTFLLLEPVGGGLPEGKTDIEAIVREILARLRQPPASASKSVAAPATADGDREKWLATAMQVAIAVTGALRSGAAKELASAPGAGYGNSKEDRMQDVYRAVASVTARSV